MQARGGLDSDGRGWGDRGIWGQITTPVTLMYGFAYLKKLFDDVS
jgi:hypothetical protein